MIISSVQDLNSRCRQVDDLVVHQDRVDHLSRAHVLEVQSQHAPRSRVDPSMRRLACSFLERLAYDEVIYAVLGAREAALNVPEVIARQEPNSIEALLAALAVKRRPSL